jgi:hypothetical protein
MLPAQIDARHPAHDVSTSGVNGSGAHAPSTEPASAPHAHRQPPPHSVIVVEHGKSSQPGTAAAPSAAVDVSTSTTPPHPANINASAISVNAASHHPAPPPDGLTSRGNLAASNALRFRHLTTCRVFIASLAWSLRTGAGEGNQ